MTIKELDKQIKTWNTMNPNYALQYRDTPNGYIFSINDGIWGYMKVFGKDFVKDLKVSDFVTEIGLATKEAFLDTLERRITGNVR